ncbi:MAG: hypothetical protein HY688_02610 [Chloroflexi bacterium]|nr:hypothetical protein [Chloroflexota bacterium]
METYTAAIERTGAESQGPLEALAAHFEQAYRQEILRVRRFGGDLVEARRLYQQWHVYREALAARDRALWGVPARAPAAKAA